jgi:eukaryotic-like serine/threonine-protein kinase
MDPERWRKIEDLFHGALEQPESERSAWLQGACGDDRSLLSEVESLLESENSAAIPSIHDQVATAVKATAKSLEQERFTKTIGPYRILQQIGRGGMGTVYLAERADGHFEKRVAVKMVQPGLDTEFILTRFRRERQVLAQFDHPNIGRLLDGGTTPDGIPYFVMEYIEGDWITRHCESNHLSVEDRLRLFRRVCSAVHYAHLHFVVHRDLKPGNILVDGKSQPKLLDFGICKLLYREATDPNRTGTLGMRLLTPEYASPEQVRGEPVTIASDIYSLGAVLYELLTGVRPHLFPKLTPQVVEQVVCEQEIAIPSSVAREQKLAARLRGDLDNIILHAMQKDPGRRYETVEQFSADVRRHLTDEPILARADTWRYRSRKFMRRNRIGMGVSAALILTFLAGLSSGQLRERLNPREEVSGGRRDAIPQSALATKDRLELLIELGDSYAGDQRWNEALTAYEQALSLLPPDPTADDETMGRRRVRIGEGINQAHQHQVR